MLASSSVREVLFNFPACEIARQDEGPMNNWFGVSISKVHLTDH